MVVLCERRSQPYDGRVQSSNPSPRPVLCLLAVLGVMLLAADPGAELLRRLLMDANGPAWVQAFAGIIQAIAAVVLVVFTVVTVKATQKSADAAAVSAEATRAAVAESVQSREQAHQHFVQDAAPIIAFTVAPPRAAAYSLDYADFDLVVRNVGRGPALDVSILVSGEGRLYKMTARLDGPPDIPGNQRPMEPLVLPLTLAPGETVQLNVTSDWDGSGGITNPQEWAIISAEYRDIFSGQFRSSSTIRGTGILQAALGGGGPALSSLRYQRIAPERTDDAERSSL